MNSDFKCRLFTNRTNTLIHLFTRFFYHFFNTSGMVYRDRGLKDKLPKMSAEQQYAALASDGMLVKRPLLITKDRVLVGFREAEWAELFV